jgi:hypothetical protein
MDVEGYLDDHIEFRAPDDQAAVAHARQYLDRHDAEVWLTRIVARLMPTAH